MKVLSIESGTQQGYLWQGFKSPTWWVKRQPIFFLNNSLERSVDVTQYSRLLQPISISQFLARPMHYRVTRAFTLLIGWVFKEFRSHLPQDPSCSLQGVTYCSCLTRRTLSIVEISIFEAEQMEIIAIVVLGLSALVGFSTSKPKPNFKTDPRREEDPDWAFTEACDSDSNSGKA